MKKKTLIWILVVGLGLALEGWVLYYFKFFDLKLYTSRFESEKRP